MRTRIIYSHIDGHKVAEFRNGECVFLDESYYGQTRDPGYLLMPDIKPYRSQIDGSMITSRSQHREHLRQHNCVEVGNDSSLTRPRQPLGSPPGLKEKIIRAVNEVEAKQRRR